MRANEEALRATNLDCLGLGHATKIHGDIFVSNVILVVTLVVMHKFSA